MSRAFDRLLQGNTCHVFPPRSLARVLLGLLGAASILYRVGTRFPEKRPRRFGRQRRHRGTRRAVASRAGIWVRENEPGAEVARAVAADHFSRAAPGGSQPPAPQSQEEMLSPARSRRRFTDVYAAIDDFQQRRRWLGFPLAVVQKYSDDQAGYLAATITYYAFFSLFPLLLVLSTGLGFLLRGHRHLQQSIVNSALGQFPVIGQELHQRSLHGSTLALILGLVAALWAGIGVFLAAQNAMNQLWGVPFKHRPNAFSQRGRALLLLLVLGGGALATTILAGLGSVGTHFGLAWKVGSIALSTALNIGLFWLAFRLLTAKDVSWRQLRGGALGAGIAYEALQTVGGYYVGHTLKNASNLYGTFGLVIGLLSWIYLAAHITLLAAEANVVASKHLWPRSLSQIVQQPPTQADKHALTQRGKTEERRHDETISVEIPTTEGDGTSPIPGVGVVSRAQRTESG
jgi:membrane protein